MGAGIAGTCRSRRARLAVVGVIAVVLLAGCQLDLGSAGNQLGVGPVATGGNGYNAFIGGPFSNKADGDPFDTHCQANNASTTSCDSGGANPDYSSAGQLYAVEVPSADVGTPVTVSIYDPAFVRGDLTGDAYGAATAPGPFATQYQLFDTTGDEQNISTDPSLGMAGLGQCTDGPGTDRFAAGSTTGAGAWVTLCTFTPTQAGIYPLVVKTSDIPGVTDRGAGINVFSLRATTSGALQPNVYALNTLWAYFGGSGSQATGSTITDSAYLANVGSAYAGHEMQVNVYDPGDISVPVTGNGTLQILPPAATKPGATPVGGPPISCDYSPSEFAQAEEPSPTAAMSSNCLITVNTDGTFPYNGHWLTIAIDIPSDYTCSTNCHWVIQETAHGYEPTMTDGMTIQVDLSTDVVTPSTTTSTTPAS